MRRGTRKPVERTQRAHDRDPAAEPADHLVLRTYLGRVLAEFRHPAWRHARRPRMGVLIVGRQRRGQSELALELITRGSGLRADDVTELYHVAPQTLEGRCPRCSRTFSRFAPGHAQHPHHLRETRCASARTQADRAARAPGRGNIPAWNACPERELRGHHGSFDPQGAIAGGAGRNLAVLVEAAVRNYVLQLRGIDSTREFIRRQEQHLGDDEGN